MSILEHGDAYTAGHQKRVASLARAIAVDMGLDEERLQDLYFAGLIDELGPDVVDICLKLFRENKFTFFC